jgi:hypothetical protein
VSIFLVWKKSEIPNGDAKAKALEEFQAKLADILDWSTAQCMEGEAVTSFPWLLAKGFPISREGFPASLRLA